MTMAPVEPTSALVGLPLTAPVAEVNVSQLGRLLMV
jgi:hypothetical protein